MHRFGARLLMIGLAAAGILCAAGSLGLHRPFPPAAVSEGAGDKFFRAAGLPAPQSAARSSSAESAAAATRFTPKPSPNGIGADSLVVPLADWNGFDSWRAMSALLWSESSTHCSLVGRHVRLQT
jgi:hypothetical protein